MAREAEALGYVLKPDYADKCHLCQEAREVLRPMYPEVLVPARHYVWETCCERPIHHRARRRAERQGHR